MQHSVVAVVLRGMAFVDCHVCHTFYVIARLARVCQPYEVLIPAFEHQVLDPDWQPQLEISLPTSFWH